VGFSFGCFHKKTSFPFTLPLKVRQSNRVANTYVVCLDCGREMPYIWREMRIVKERRRAQKGERSRRACSAPASVETVHREC